MNQRRLVGEPGPGQSYPALPRLVRRRSLGTSTDAFCSKPSQISLFLSVAAKWPVAKEEIRKMTKLQKPTLALGLARHWGFIGHSSFILRSLLLSAPLLFTVSFSCFAQEVEQIRIVEL